jgi:transcriptional regulator with XRE-family HTH domain
VSYFRYNQPYSVTMGPRAHSFLEYPPVPIQPMGNFIDAAGVSATTGSQALDTVIKWGFWIGMGLVGYRMYRVLRYNDPFIQPPYKLPPAWQANGRRPSLCMEDVQALHEEGLSLDEMSARLGVHESTVRGYLKRLGLRPHRHRSLELEYNKKRALEMYEQGMYIPDIAYILDWSGGNVRSWLKRKGVYVPGKQGARGAKAERDYRWFRTQVERERERSRKRREIPGWEAPSAWRPNPVRNWEPRSKAEEFAIFVVGAPGEYVDDLAVEFGIDARKAHKWLNDLRVKITSTGKIAKRQPGLWGGISGTQEAWRERSPEDQEIVNRAIELYEPGSNLSALARYLNVSPTTLRAWLIREGKYESSSPRTIPQKLSISRGLRRYHRDKRRGRRNPVDEPELHRVCGWCKRLFVDGEWVVADPPDEWVTHGICEECNERFMREIELAEQEEERRR